MKKYIKDGKIYNAPVVITINGRRITSNSDSYLAKFGYTPYTAPEKAPLTATEQIERSNADIDARTDEKILNGFTFNDEEFKLTIENQINFGNMFTAREFLDYPQTVKTKNGFYQLPTSGDVEAFYLSGVAYIKECLEEGWQEKEAAKQAILNQ